jgi:dienelactone hydrolase
MSLTISSFTDAYQLFAVAFAADAAPLPSPRQVDIPSGSGTLHAQLYKPDGDGPFPVVIAVHGCGGTSELTADGTVRLTSLVPEAAVALRPVPVDASLEPQLRAYTPAAIVERLAGQGFAVEFTYHRAALEAATLSERFGAGAGPFAPGS